MKIVDIITDSALLLGLNEEVAILKTVTEDTEPEILRENISICKLFNLVQYSIKEFCTNYVPIVEERKIETTEKQFHISNFENFIRINYIVKDKQLTKFKILNRCLTFEEDGEYVVNYATYPKISSMLDELNFLECYSPDVLVFGLCAYFSLSHGMFTEFAEFHEKYILKAESLKSLRNFDLPCRRWE